jgi:hypothetical protein
MKKLITSYAFNKTAKTVTLSGVTAPLLERVLLIVNITTGTIIYQFNDPVLGGTLAGSVLTLEYDTSAMSNTDKLQIFYDSPDGETTTLNPLEDTAAAPVRLTPNPSWRTSFTSAISNGVNSLLTLLQTGSGQTVNQTGGNLLITTGTTVNAETVIRSKQGWTNNSMVLRYMAALSQRIVNQSFYIELVDVIGDSLAYTINSATSVTVTIPNNPLDSTSIGQAVNLDIIAGAAGVPGRYVIAAVSGNDVTFTVAGWPASGTGTLSLTGWNSYQVLYDSTVVTNAKFDAQRRGYNSGFTTATINTTAAPGHIGQVYSEDTFAAFSDSLAASSTAVTFSQRASRLANLPAGDATLYVQVRILNGTVAPASTTTLTLGFISVEEFVDTPVSIRSGKQVGAGVGVPVQVGNTVTINTPAVTQSTGLNTTQWNAAGYAGLLAIDVASAAITTTTTTAAVTPGAVANLGVYAHSFNVVVTAATGTTPTLDVGVEESIDNGTNWVRIYDFERITATGAYTSPLIRSQYGTRFRYVQTVAGTTPSFTRAINRVQHSQPGQHFRRFIDRTININTLNSVTPTYNVEGLEMIELIASIGAVTTTAPIIQLEGSETGIAADFYAIGTPVTAVASTAVRSMYTGELPKFVRARVSTAGSGATAGYVAIKGMGRS